MPQEARANVVLKGLINVLGWAISAGAGWVVLGHRRSLAWRTPELKTLLDQRGAPPHDDVDLYVPGTMRFVPLRLLAPTFETIRVGPRAANAGALFQKLGRGFLDEAGAGASTAP